MAVDFDFSDVDAAFDEFYEEAKEAMIEVGEDAVQYAKDNGDYQDHTGTLRKSNEYSDYLTEILEVIYEDVSGDDANE